MRQLGKIKRFECNYSYLIHLINDKSYILALGLGVGQQDAGGSLKHYQAEI